MDIYINHRPYHFLSILGRFMRLLPMFIPSSFFYSLTER